MLVVRIMASAWHKIERNFIVHVQCRYSSCISILKFEVKTLWSLIV
jgi:hypothetical protein